MQVLTEYLRAHCAGELKQAESMALHTTFKIGGPAELLFRPRDEEELCKALREAAERGVMVTVIGNGSNLLVADEGVPGLVVQLGSPWFRLIQICPDGGVLARAGAALGALVEFLADDGYGEHYFLAGIPATIGGAVAMNAGSAEKWIGQRVRKVSVVTTDGRHEDLNQEQMCFERRNCALGGCIITEVVFDFPREETSRSVIERDAFLKKRAQRQDLSAPNAGCIFKNPEDSDRTAGQLIEAAGLKGSEQGGAVISEKHANFILNRGGASARDVLGLLEAARTQVYERFGVRLVPEIRFIPERQS